MGGKSAQTIGFWYLIAQMFGLTKGPVDALLELRGGDKTAWSGEQTESGTITVSARDLWGGEKGEGGIEGSVDVQMGEAAQVPNAYMISTFGAQQPARRGFVSLVFKGGRYGAISPYAPQKPLAVKLRRILQGWDNDTCWYPETAPIGIIPAEAAFTQDIDLGATTEAGGDASVGVEISGLSPADVYRVDFPSGRTYTAWSGFDHDIGNCWTCQLQVTTPEGATTYFAAEYIDAPTAFTAAQTGLPILLTGSESYAFWLADTIYGDNRGGLSITVSRVGTPSLLAMNPAHILYDTITSVDGQGEPIGLINDTNFRASADTLFDEGFGLCMLYDPNQQPNIRDFQQTVCDAIGACMTQSRVTGEYFLDLIRDDYVFEDLPIIAAADILTFSRQISVPLEATNQVLVEWFDPQSKQVRTTAPVKALGLIRAAGKVISETKVFHCLPSESLALRVATRELRAKATPLSRFTLTTNRKAYNLRPGQPFRLQMPGEGVEDIVCRVVEIDHGTLSDGRIKLVAVQDVYWMPAVSDLTVGDSPGLEEPPSTVPEDPAAQVAFEAPYLELASRLSGGDLAGLGDTAGYLAIAAAAPATGVGINYSVYTAADGESYVDRGLGYWSPSALVVEAADPTDTAFTLTNAYALSEVEVDSAALWGNELVRVDAIDADAGTLTLARGCGDTVPQDHAAGERIWFYDADVSTDGREYVDGELVHVKLLTRTTSAERPLVRATAIDVTMDQRQVRPYAPGDLKINTESYPSFVNGLLTVSWVHRDRLLQADQLVESVAASIGPEAGVTYRLRLYNQDDDLLVDVSSLTGTSYTWDDESVSGGDVYWSQVSSRLAFDGADTSTTFTDAAGKTWTAFGNAQLSTARSIYGSASGRFDGTGDYVSTPAHADHNPGTGDFSIEVGAYFENIGSDLCIASNYQSLTVGLSLQVSTLGKLMFYTSGDGPDLIGATTLVNNQFYWLQVVREAGVLKLGVDGVVDGSVANTTNITSTQPLVLGGLYFGGSLLSPLQGNLDEWRFTKGRARTIGLPGAAMPVTQGYFNSQFRVRLGALRDGLASWQEHDITVARSGYGFGYGYVYGE